MKQPSFFRIVFTDYWCCVLFGLAILQAVFFVLVVTVPLSILCALLLLRRVQMIRNVFSQGVSASGVITQKASKRGEWLLRYAYVYDSNTYERGNYVLRTWVKLGKGDRVEVFVNPHKPTQAFLTAFYLG